MTLQDVLSSSRQQGVQLYLKEGKLAVRAKKGSVPDDLLAAIKMFKDEIICFLEKNDLGNDELLPAITPMSAAGSSPLSYAQERLWFIEQMHEDTTQFNITSEFDLDGELERQAFDTALDMLMRRQQSLRTSFFMENGEARQFVLEEYTLPVKYSALLGLSIAQQANVLSASIDNEHRTPFNLNHGPLLRVHVLSLTQTLHKVLYTVHHIVSDGWSNSLFTDELKTIYRAIVAGEQPQLPDLPVQYADFAVWQRKFVTNENLKPQLDYWLKHLAGMPKGHGIQLDNARGKVQPHQGRLHRLVLSRELTEQLRAYCQVNSVTPFIALQTIFAVLLAKHGDDPDVVMGLVVAGRTQRETEPLIGLFVNSLVLRSRFSLSSSFQELLAENRKTILDAYANQHVPFDFLVERLNPTRELNKNPLFQIMIIHVAEQNESVSFAVSSEENAKRIPLRTDMDLYIEETKGGETRVDFVFNDAIFLESTIALIAKRLEYVLDQVLRNPCLSYDAIELDLEPDSEFFEQYDRSCSGSTSAPHTGESDALSYHQQRLWFIDKFERNVLYDGSPTYHNIPLIIDLEGNVELQRLQESVNYVVSQHRILRDLFCEQADSMFISGVSSSCQTIEFESISDLHEHDDALMDKLLAAARANFKFDNDCLFRAKLFQTGESHFSLLVVFHHLIADRQSTLIFARQLLHAYENLSALSIHDGSSNDCAYQRFASLQSDQTESRFKAHFAFWRSRLGAGVKPLELPTDRPRKAIHEYQAGTATFVFDAELSAMISASCQAYGYAERDFFLAAFKALLFRYSGHEEIVVGIVAENRKSTRLVQAIGPFSNLLVTRDSLSSDESFLDVIKNVARTRREAEKYGAIPFDWMVRELALKVDMSRTALFDVLFHYEVCGKELQVLAGSHLKAVLRETNLGYGKYDLNLLVLRHEQHVELKICFNEDMFDRATIGTFLQHFQRLLKAIAHRPSLEVGSINILSQEEIQSQHHEDITEMATSEPLKCIHEYFEQFARATPDAVALVFDDRKITYRSLNERANQVAHYLRKRGVIADTLVGLCVERSLDMLVGLIGILKAGGAYVPIDAGYPESRIQFLLDDSGVQIVLTQEEIGRHWDLARQQHLIYLDSDRTASGEVGIFSSQPKTNLPVLEIGLDSSNLAYVIYTSGSTGKPKGVLIEHRNIVRLFDKTDAQFGFSCSDRWTLFHSISFDFSVWEIWGALKFGGQLVIVPKLVAQSPRDFYQLLVNENVTILNQTPSAFSQVIDIDLAEKKQLSLRAVIFGGEALKMQTLVPWIARHGDQRIHLVNMYGITETTVHVTYRRLLNHDIGGVQPSVIGTPISDLQIYLLDGNLSFVPRGVIAEIYVGGAGLARGYHRRPDLTEARFITACLSGDRVQRLYKTGDLARWRKDGGLEYIGRADDQVKIRGFRIELGEIEAQLARHPTIRSSLVVVRLNAVGEGQLVAYVVRNAASTDAGEQNLAHSLRLHLHANLPEYMIPDAYVELEKFPLTTNGKVDKRALPEPQISAYSLGDYIPPSTTIESELVRLWAALLGHDAAQLSTTANFFALGGHSLIATRLFSDIRQTFGVELPLRTLFEAPTISGLAERISGCTEKVQIPPITRASSKARKVLSFAQQRLWFIDQFGQGSVEYNSPGRHVVRGCFDVNAFRQAFHCLLERHEVLRTVYLSNNGIAEQQLLADYKLPFSVFDLSNLTEVEQREQLESISNEEAKTPFSLAQDPMLRIRLVKLSDSEHHILYTFHHIACDGWSTGIFNRELTALYRAFSTAMPSPLAPLEYQYADFSAWQRTWLCGDLLDGQIQFWRERLAGAPAVHNLPLDGARPEVLTYDGKICTKPMSNEQSAAVKRYCESNDITPFMFFHTVFSVLLCRLSNSNDIVVGTPLSGRTHKSLESMIGLFVNTLVLRTRIDEDMDFPHLLAENKRSTLDCFGHQDLPFDILVDEVVAERSVNHAPVFQIIFAMQNNEVGTLKLDGEGAHQEEHSESVPPGGDFADITTRFDLELHVEEDGGNFSFSWIFNTLLFREDTITGFAQCLFNLVASILRDVETSNTAHLTLSSLQMLDETEPFASVKKWGGSASTLLPACSYLDQVAADLAGDGLTKSASSGSSLQLVVLNRALQIQPLGVVGNVGFLSTSPRGDSADPGCNEVPQTNHGCAYATSLLGRMLHTGDLLLAQEDSYTRSVEANRQMHKLKTLFRQCASISFCHIEIDDSAIISREVACYLYTIHGQIDAGVQTKIRQELIGLIKAQHEHYLIPERFVFLDSMPATINGAVDRRALTLSVASRQVSERVLPRTGIERFLCGLWESLLERSDIGVHDNFFSMGGHSLLTTRVISAIRAEFDVEVSVQSVFQNPTISEIGKQISMQVDARNMHKNRSELEHGDDEIEEGVF